MVIFFLLLFVSVNAQTNNHNILTYPDDYFTVTSGPCEIHADSGTSDPQICVTSDNYPSDYTTSTTCSITANYAGSLNVRGFKTELQSGSCLYDYVTIASTRYCYTGNTLTSGAVSLSVGQVIEWKSDGSQVDTGFKICFAASDVTCQATSDTNDDTPDRASGDYYCPDGTVTGSTLSGCTCTPFDCEIQFPATETWHRECFNGNASGVAGSCACDCPVDAFGLKQYFGGKCGTDTDECTNVNIERAVHDCHANATCTNTPGSFICECDNGFDGDGVTCTPKQCVLDSNPTEPWHISCTNGVAAGTTGDCSCQCPLNGANKQIYYGDSCETDVDECTNTNLDHATNGCATQALCVNTNGGFGCSCQTTSNPSDDGTNFFGRMYCLNGDATGFRGDCGCNCTNGFSGDNCDQCVTSELGCVSGAAAVSGSNCACACPKDGTLFQTTGTLCENDVDECTNTFGFYASDNCDANAACQNFFGGFNCTCNAGYSGDGVTCTPVPCENSANPTEIYQIDCKNGGNATGLAGSCACDCAVDENGLLEFYGGTCQNDVDECTNTNVARASENCDVNAQCTNTVGGFTCTCNTGYTGDGVTCTPVQCVNSETPTEIWEIDCKNGGNATGLSGSCTCDCPRDESGLLQFYGGTCQNDVDECTNSNVGRASENCDSNAACTNIVGSFTCACNSGWTGDGLTCSDVDECTLGTDNCDSNAACTNIDGSFTCACNSGWNGDGLTCSDVDECTLGTDNCDSNAACTNIDGSFTCACNSGWNGDGLTCSDVDECTLGTDNCDSNAACTNIDGSFTCACNSGWNGDGLTCSDANECSLETDDCEDYHECVNINGDHLCLCKMFFFTSGSDSNGNPVCICPAGLELQNPAPGSQICTACESGKTNPNPDSTCQNSECPADYVLKTSGVDATLPYNSVSNCEACAVGYFSSDPFATSCLDEDECALGTDICDSDATCANTVGGYNCTCNAGFFGDGFTCGEKPCEANSNPTEPHHRNCLNGANASGFAGNCGCDCAEDSNGLKIFFGGICGNDVDECTNTDPLRASHTCDGNATCSNTVGGFNCSCNEGYIGDGFACEPHYCVTNRTLTEPNHWDCANFAVATGLVGSCACDCPKDEHGLQFYFGARCGNDVDECTNINPNRASHDCHADATCVNTYGGFNCTCDPGYVGNGTQCEPAPCEVNSALTEPQHIDCQNGANATGVFGNCGCECPRDENGLLKFYGSLCGQDTDECAYTSSSTLWAYHNCDLNATCSNTVGSFECACDAGFSGNGTHCEPVQCEVNSSVLEPQYIDCENGANATGVTGSCGCDCPKDESGLLQFFGGFCGQDTDECTNTNVNRAVDNCNANAQCSNTIGSFECACNEGYVGDGVNCDLKNCTQVPWGDSITAGNHSCLYGNVVGLYGSCGCDCNNGFTGLRCSECAPGFGFDNGSCVACENFQANGLYTHDAPCVDHSCPAGQGVISDGFSFNLNNTDLSNCVACDGVQASPEGSGVCVTQFCDANERVVNTTDFDHNLNSSESNSNCEPCAAGYGSLAGTNPVCDIFLPCNATLIETDYGMDGNYYCRHGVVGGVTGSCTCTCERGFTGSFCDFCPAGSGASLLGSMQCVACDGTTTTDQTDHDAPCVEQICGIDRGLGSSFDHTLDGTVDNANCEPCLAGFESPADNNTCTPILCGINERVVNHTCVPCPPGSLNVNGSDDASGPNTFCDGIECFENERVVNSICFPCPAGTTNEAGDPRDGADTTCDPVLCNADEYVLGNTCTPCAPGTANPAGDDSSGVDTQCAPILCGEDFFVLNNVCQACPLGFRNLPGDDSSGPNTLCVQGCQLNEYVENNVCKPCPAGFVAPEYENPEGPNTTCTYSGVCGDVTCNQGNTAECSNAICVCKTGFVGRSCGKTPIADDSSNTNLKQDVVDLFAPLNPNDSNVIEFQAQLTEYLSDIVTGFVQQGQTTDQVVREHLVEIDRLTVQQQIIAEVLGKATLLAAAPTLSNISCVDSSCASFNYKGVEELVFLHTPPGAYSIVAKANTLVTKQFSINNTFFEMQCWDGSQWGITTTTQRNDLYTCNGFIILIGSQAPICMPDVTEQDGSVLVGTCGTNGACAQDGLSFRCLCNEGYRGDFCEEEFTPTKCAEIDCNSYGGYSPGALNFTNITNCCQYDTRADFDAVCDSVTDSNIYTELGCCLRQFCV